SGQFGTLTPGPDIFGNARPQGTRYDIGAYQVSLGCPEPTGVGCH
ncbi:MAG: choice-of-anchor Q domain-containing protein, partial [Rhodanobacteraceae bacterium]